jgi:hypothetical protein
MRHYKLLQRSFDIVKIDVGHKAVDAGINAGQLLSMHIAVRGNEIGKHLQIGETARVGGVGSIAADPLKVVR